MPIFNFLNKKKKKDHYNLKLTTVLGYFTASLSFYHACCSRGALLWKIKDHG